MNTFTSLAGHFLISTPQMPDPRFARQVVYICSHDEEGAMGVAVNTVHPAISFAEILQGLGMASPEAPVSEVYIGGPVDIGSAFILFNSEYRAEHQLNVSGNVALTREMKVLEDIISGVGPEEYLFILGYAGWGPGQLESELIRQGWLALPATEDIIFRMDNNSKWKAAGMQYGIDITIYEDEAGYA